MSRIKEKSEFNIEAAEHLLNKSLYAPSVHCSYYSCYQLLKYTVKNFFGVDYEKQSEKITSSKQNSHQYILNYFVTELRKFTNTKESLDFKRSYKDLQQFRIESDYENVEVNSIKGKSAFDKAKEIRNYIIKNF